GESDQRTRRRGDDLRNRLPRPRRCGAVRRLVPDTECHGHRFRLRPRHRQGLQRQEVLHLEPRGAPRNADGAEAITWTIARSTSSVRSVCPPNSAESTTTYSMCPTYPPTSGAQALTTPVCEPQASTSDSLRRAG